MIIILAEINTQNETRPKNRVVVVFLVPVRKLCIIHSLKFRDSDLVAYCACTHSMWHAHLIHCIVNAEWGKTLYQVRRFFSLPLTAIVFIYSQADTDFPKLSIQSNSKRKKYTKAIQFNFVFFLCVHSASLPFSQIVFCSLFFNLQFPRFSVYIPLITNIVNTWYLFIGSTLCMAWGRLLAIFRKHHTEHIPVCITRSRQWKMNLAAKYTIMPTDKHSGPIKTTTTIRNILRI